MDNWSVYKHTTPSGKVYIGVTSKEPKERWNSGHGYKKCKAFWNAIVKYGWKNIQHEVLYRNLSKQDAERLEQELIAQCQSRDCRYGYNIASGGCVNFGIPAWNKGLPKEQQPHYGKSMPQEQREKIARTLSKPIVCVETNTIYESAQEAARTLGIQFSNISRCLHGRTQRCGGYHWRWLNER